MVGDIIWTILKNPRPNNSSSETLKLDINFLKSFWPENWKVTVGAMFIYIRPMGHSENQAQSMGPFSVGPKQSPDHTFI